MNERLSKSESDPTTRTQDVTINYYPHASKIVQVDVLIAPCIQACNDADFWTKFCCSGHEIDNFAGGYVMFGYTPNSEDLVNILEEIPEFTIEHRLRYETRDGNFDGVMKDPTDEQIEAFKRYVSEHWDVPLMYTKNIIIRMAHRERRDAEFRDENLKITKRAFEKLEGAIRNYAKV